MNRSILILLVVGVAFFAGSNGQMTFSPQWGKRNYEYLNGISSDRDVNLSPRTHGPASRQCDCVNRLAVIHDLIKTEIENMQQCNGK